MFENIFAMVRLPNGLIFLFAPSLDAFVFLWAPVLHGVRTIIWLKGGFSNTTTTASIVGGNREALLMCIHVDILIKLN